jgi:GntR family transcriptional regulator
MTLDTESPVPLYYQLKQLLLAAMEHGQLKPGDILPTENQIQEKYDVSRTTVRKALSELEAEGKVSRYRGRGTFVAKPKVSHNPKEYPNLADHMMIQGMVAGWELISAEWILAPEDIAEQLRVNSNQRVFCLKRLRLENSDPIGYHIAYVSPLFANIIDATAFTDGGSLRYLRNQQILETSYANRVIEAVPAGPDEARLLNVPRGAPLLKINRLIFNAEDQPVEAFQGLYRGDRFQYHLNNMRAISQINA